MSALNQSITPVFNIGIAIYDKKDDIIEIVIDLPEKKDKAWLHFLPQGSTMDDFIEAHLLNQVKIFTNQIVGKWQGHFIVNTKHYQKGSFIVHIDVDGLHYFSNWIKQ